jgi:hypothetical protein
VSAGGAVALGAPRGKLAMLEIACTRCDRAGRLSLDRLIAKHGADTGLPELRTVLAGDCPRIRSVAIHDRCGVYFPKLPNADDPTPALMDAIVALVLIPQRSVWSCPSRCWRSQRSAGC